MDGGMKLPVNFQRVRVFGHTTGDRAAANGWNVQVGNKAAFIPRPKAKIPGFVRRRLEAVLGISAKPPKSEEDMFTARARKSAQAKRAGHNAYAQSKANGVKITVPWARPRTLAKILSEERTMEIAAKWQRMGEFRK